MKKLVLICLALVMGTGIALAGKPVADKKNTTAVFVKKIMNNVPSLGKGIKDVQVDLPTKEVTVVYDATKNNEANIIRGFASIKVKAEPKPAAEKK